MGREKRAAPGVSTGDHAKERHKRDRRGNLIDWTAPLPPGLVARPDRPLVSSKHKSWFEFIENKDRKKKLEFEFTERREPPPGFEFVPIGNPALTTACKELSRERGAMIFIVTTSSHGFSKRLSLHLNRVGHHIRQTIFEEARASLGDSQLALTGTAHGIPEPIPERQEEINKQADAAIRDLFPRIPNTDRQMIIEHAFNKSKRGPKGDPPVGLAPDIALSRRVALAVLAHIRHNHTRYDHLLKETSYVNARKAVESLCLDILVKWRGDEETGRDQLDEILCEVIVISDSESDESDDDDEEDSSSVVSSVEDKNPVGLETKGENPSRPTTPPVNAPAAYPTSNNSRGEGLPRASHAPQRVQKVSSRDRREAKWAQRGFHRYQAARDEAWDQALERQRFGNKQQLQAAESPAMDMPSSHGTQPWRSAEPVRVEQRTVAARSSPAGPVYTSHLSYGPPLPSTDVSREREPRVGEPQRTVSAAACHGSQTARAAQYPPNGGLRPIVGSRALPYGTAEVERVSYQGQDLKDYLVPSIEPASPESSNFTTRFPAHHRQPEPGLPYGPDRPMRLVTPYPTSTGPEVTSAPQLRPAYPEEGFIRLPPRPDPSRMPAAHGQRTEPLVAPNLQSISIDRGSAAAATSIGLEPQRPSAWQDAAIPRGGDPMLRSRSRPIWVGHDGVILRSESRPIHIPDYPSPSRQPRADPTYAMLDDRRPSPTTWTSDPRHAGHILADGRSPRPINPTIDQRIESLPDDFVEIVRVSNKFPRQHEPRPASAGARRYNLRSAAPSQPHDDVIRHDSQYPPMQGQRVERVVGAVERPVFSDENAPLVSRQPERRPRQERVVGVEYVHANPVVDTRSYPDCVPFYDVGGDVHRSRSASALPVPYLDFLHQSQAARPVPRRDGPYVLD